MFYRGSIPPPLTVTPKFNYMEKELLTIELINTVYDHESMNGANTVAVLYDYSKTRYMAVDVDHDRIGSKEITIL